MSSVSFCFLGGAKAVLIERLTSSDDGKKPTELRSKNVSPANEDSDDEPLKEAPNSKTYDSMKRDELLKLCKARKLQRTGNIASLVERLEHQDEVRKLVESEKDKFIEDVLCDGCRGANFLADVNAPAVWYCESCSADQNLCERCKDAHQRVTITRDLTRGRILPLTSLLTS